MLVNSHTAVAAAGRPISRRARADHTYTGIATDVDRLFDRRTVATGAGRRAAAARLESLHRVEAFVCEGKGFMDQLRCETVEQIREGVLCNVHPPISARNPVSSFPDAKCCANAALNDVDPAIGHACSPSGHSVLGGAASTTAFRLARARLEAFSTHALLTSEYPVGQVFVRAGLRDAAPGRPEWEKDAGMS